MLATAKVATRKKRTARARSDLDIEGSSYFQKMWWLDSERKYTDNSLISKAFFAIFYLCSSALLRLTEGLSYERFSKIRGS